MTNPNWQKAKEIFVEALRQTPGARSQFLDKSCGSDTQLRREVESLLNSLDNAGSFMQSPAIGEVADVIIPDKAQKEGKYYGHYQIIKLLGIGGMGEVYLAQDNRLDRRVAVKILNEKFAGHESNLRRFTQEAKAASALNHPNILIIHEIGVEGDVNFIVSEFVEGVTLRKHFNQVPLRLAEFLDISIQISNALAAAHAVKIIHRDIKPENIMIRPDGYAKILDFGLAKLIEQKAIGFEDETAQPLQTAQGIILGTIDYMSPEQAQGKAVDGRTDIFSFGIVLYEILSGKRPFTGDSMGDVFAAILKTEPEPLTGFGIPKELSRIVNKALRKNVDERYQHIKDLLIDLRDFKQASEFEEKLKLQKLDGLSIFADELDKNPNAETQLLEVDSMAKTSEKPAATNAAVYPTAKHSTLLRRFFVPRRTIIYAVILLALMLGILAYIRLWPLAPPASPAEIKSLAVLPLKSLDTGDNYLGLGIADAVIRRINQTGKLIVRPTSAVRRYLTEDTDALTAARQLNADAVLEGSVQRAGDRLRVSINLLRTADGTSLWADNFDMQITDIFKIQDTVAQQVASRLKLRLDPAQQARLTAQYTPNPIAYEFYVKGVYNFDQRVSFATSKSQMEATIGFFKQAIEADPNFALAHAQLAYVYAIKGVFVEPSEKMWEERAKEEINQAQLLDPQLAEIHLVRFQLLFSSYEGYQGEAAVRELLLAQQLNPNAGHAELVYLYTHLGLEDFAAREVQRASEIDPTSDFLKEMIRNMYEMGGQYDEYAAHRELYRDDITDVWYFMGTGRLDEAQKAIEALSAQKPDSIYLPAKKALLLALKGDFQAAEAGIPLILSRHPVKDPFYHHAAYDIACIYALEAKSDEAVKWLREANTSGFQSNTLFERDPYLNRIRQSPEFIQFLTEMKTQNEGYRHEFASTL